MSHTVDPPLPRHQTLKHPSKSWLRGTRVNDIAQMPHFILNRKVMCFYSILYILTIIPLHVGKTIFKKHFFLNIYIFKWKGQHFLQTWILLKTCGISWVDRVDCRASKLCLTPESQWPKGCPSRKVGCQALVDNKSTCNWRLRAHDKLLRRWHFLVVVYLCC